MLLRRHLTACAQVTSVTIER